MAVTVWFVHLSPDNIGTLLVAVLVAVMGWRVDKRGKRIEVIVNGRYDNLVARTKQLEDELYALGHKPPPDPAIPPVQTKE